MEEKGKEEEQQEKRVECRRKIEEEVKEMKRRIEEKEKKERKNNMVIRGLKQGESDLKEEAKTFIEKEFGVNESVRKVQVIRKERNCYESNGDGELGGKRKNRKEQIIWQKHFRP